MKRQLVFGSVCAAAVLSGGPGQTALGAEADAGPWRTWANSRFGFNISADFKNRQLSSNPGDPAASGAAGNAVNRYYDDGAVLIDSSGNAGGQTMNWGFNNASQLANNVLSYHSTTSPGDGYATRIGGDPQYGFELGLGRVLTTVGDGPLGGIKIGLGGGFTYTHLDMRGFGTVSGTVQSRTDQYDASSLEGAPSGTVYQPAWPLVPGNPTDIGGSSVASAPLIPDLPQSTAGGSYPATATIRTSLKGDLLGFKLGPFFEIPLARGFALQLNGGLAAVRSDASFSWSETVTTAAPAAPLRPDASGSHAGWRMGGYAGAKLDVTLGKGWSLLMGVDYQNVGSSTISGGSKEVKLNLGNSYFVNLGVGYSF